MEENKDEVGKAWKMERVCDCAEFNMQSRSIVQLLGIVYLTI